MEKEIRRIINVKQIDLSGVFNRYKIFNFLFIEEVVVSLFLNTNELPVWKQIFYKCGYD